MDAGVYEAAEVFDEGIDRNDSVRRAVAVEVAEPIRRDVEDRFDALRDTVAGFYGVRLSAREGAGFIRYHDGGFYRTHRDRADVSCWAGAARRRIALVAFLNSTRDDSPAGEFDGGTLRVYRARGGRPHDVHPRAGLLVAFPATAIHEVTVVRGGTRDAIVDWFYDRP